MKKGAMLSITLFSLVALVHFLRLVLGWEVTVEGAIVPMWISIFGVLIPGILAFLLWRESGPA